MEYRTGIHRNIKFVDGDTLIVTKRQRIFKLGCCDCGLVHAVRASCNKKGEIRLQFFRLNRNTGQVRRRHKKEIIDELVKEFNKIK